MRASNYYMCTKFKYAVRVYMATTAICPLVVVIKYLYIAAFLLKKKYVYRHERLSAAAKIEI